MNQNLEIVKRLLPDYNKRLEEMEYSKGCAGYLLYQQEAEKGMVEKYMPVVVKDLENKIQILENEIKLLLTPKK